VAALLRKELGTEVEMIGGDRGEFTVWVGDQVVARKGVLRFPSDRNVLEAVRTALAS